MENNGANSCADKNKVGRIHTSDETVAVIAGIAATEAEGVVSLVGNITTALLGKRGVKELSNGVKVKMIDDAVSISVTINVDYERNVADICKDVQEKVIAAVENMTGLTVSKVKVCVADVTI